MDSLPTTLKKSIPAELQQIIHAFSKDITTGELVLELSNVIKRTTREQFEKIGITRSFLLYGMLQWKPGMERVVNLRRQYSDAEEQNLQKAHHWVAKWANLD